MERNFINLDKSLEYIGSACGLMAAFLVANHYFIVGWCFSFTAAVCLTIFAKRNGLNGLLIMESAFLLIALNGLYNSL